MTVDYSITFDNEQARVVCNDACHFLKMSTGDTKVQMIGPLLRV